MLILFLALLSFAGAFIAEQKRSVGFKELIENFTTVYHQKEKAQEVELTRFGEQANANYSSESPDWLESLEQNGIYLFRFKNDSCVYWSSNKVQLPTDVLQIPDTLQVLKLQTGYYQLKKRRQNNSTVIISLLLLKREWPHQNEYLQNGFVFDSNIPSGTMLLMQKAPNCIPVVSLSKNTLFYLRFYSSTTTNTALQFTAILLYTLSFLLILRLVIGWLSEIISNPFYFLVLLGSFLIGIALLVNTYRIPKVLFELDFFNPQLFADANSYWLSSMGMVFVNTLLLLLFTYVVNQKLKRATQHTPLFWFLFSVALICLSIFVIDNYLYLIQSFVFNSTAVFQLNNILSWNIYSLLGIFNLLVFLFSIYFFVRATTTSIRYHSKAVYSIASIVIGFCLVLVFADLYFVELSTTLFLVVLLYTIFLYRTRSQITPFAVGLIYIIIFSAYTVYLFERKNSEKEFNNLSSFADKLAEEKDVIAEYLFEEVSNKLSTDTALLGSLTPSTFSRFENVLYANYFGNYWTKYSIKAFAFDSVCYPLHNSLQPELTNNTYFDELIFTNGESTSCDKFFFISKDKEQYYLAKIPLYTSTSNHKPAHLYVKFESRATTENSGFPELLLDKKLILKFDISQYSYAVYKEKKLVANYGKYYYPFLYSSLSDKDYLHFTFSPTPETNVVISKAAVGYISKLSAFSVFFSLSGLVVLLVYFFFLLYTNKAKEIFSTLKWKTQTILALLVFLACTVFAISILGFIKSLNKNEMENSLNQKINSIHKELQHKLGNEFTLDKNYRPYINSILAKYANVFSTDIILYDIKGDLIASSSMAIFEEGLLSDKMNPLAFAQLNKKSASRYIHSEQIGKLTFLSGYIPFKNKSGDDIAYINLPYFAKQKLYDKEIAVYLSTIINIYSVLLVLSVLVSISIANQLTSPLQLIQQKLSTLTLGKKHELIDWIKDDEIGKLVAEYNRTVLELERSAIALAKSERESAWKEMAKQVAHEIKNPLTPMKLNIQHLQRIQKVSKDDFESKFEKITTSLLEQIDALSLIASAFSDFAKMPTSNLEKINLTELLMGATELYKNTIAINTHFDSNVEIFISADKIQLSRALSNIIKNATQAVSEKREPKLDIYLEKESDRVVLQIRDNGIGISDEMKQKIFTPNFTTKTTGMGLGLSMVKNSIESFGGNIWFESEVDKGTTFFITFPMV
ncbi:MAG: GHKL domain-containing protein [Bacteroidetes bacterium]|nr:GHKL domain-containing protein [Bacteroidota bacterium]